MLYKQWGIQPNIKQVARNLPYKLEYVCGVETKKKINACPTLQGKYMLPVPFVTCFFVTCFSRKKCLFVSRNVAVLLVFGFGKEKVFTGCFLMDPLFFRCSLFLFHGE